MAGARSGGGEPRGLHLSRRAHGDGPHRHDVGAQSPLRLRESPRRIRRFADERFGVGFLRRRVRIFVAGRGGRHPAFPLAVQDDRARRRRPSGRGRAVVPRRIVRHAAGGRLHVAGDHPPHERRRRGGHGERRMGVRRRQRPHFLQHVPVARNQPGSDGDQPADGRRPRARGVVRNGAFRVGSLANPALVHGLPDVPLLHHERRLSGAARGVAGLQRLAGGRRLVRPFVRPLRHADVRNHGGRPPRDDRRSGVDRRPELAHPGVLRHRHARHVPRRHDGPQLLVRQGALPRSRDELHGVGAGEFRLAAFHVRGATGRARNDRREPRSRARRPEDARPRLDGRRPGDPLQRRGGGLLAEQAVRGEIQRREALARPSLVLRVRILERPGQLLGGARHADEPL